MRQLNKQVNSLQGEEGKGRENKREKVKVGWWQVFFCWFFCCLHKEEAEENHASPAGDPLPSFREPRQLFRSHLRGGDGPTGRGSAADGGDFPTVPHRSGARGAFSAVCTSAATARDSFPLASHAEPKPAPPTPSVSGSLLQEVI